MAFNKEKVMDAARKFVDKGQVDKAVKEYLRVVKEDPQDVRVWLKIGDLYAKKGSKQEASETYLKVARFYQDQGFFLKAVAVYKQILKIDPRLVEVNLKLAELYRQLGLLSDAMQHFESVAAHFHREGKTKEALATVRQLVDLDPENIATRIKLAELYSKESMTAEAVAEFAVACDQLRKQNRIDDFVKVAERLLWHKADNLTLNRELAGLYLRRNDPRRALQKLQACFKADPRDVETLALLAQAFQALEQKSKTVSVLKELARILDENRQRDKAEEVHRKILQFVPTDPDSLAYLGDKVRPSLAAEALRPAFGPSPARGTGAQPRLTFTSEVSAVGSPPEARMTGAIPLVEGSDFALPEYADDQGDFSEELSLDDGVYGRPGSSSSFAGEQHAEEIAKILTETDVYIKYGLHQKAIDHLRRVFALDTDNLEARERLKEVLLSQGREREAVGELMRLAEATVKHDPDRAEGYLCELLQVDGTYRPAFELARRFKLDVAAERPAGSVGEIDLDSDAIAAGQVAAIDEDIDFEDIEFSEPGRRAAAQQRGGAGRPESFDGIDPAIFGGGHHAIGGADVRPLGPGDATRQVAASEVEALAAMSSAPRSLEFEDGVVEARSPQVAPGAAWTPTTRSLDDVLDEQLDDALGEDIDQDVAAELSQSRPLPIPGNGAHVHGFGRGGPSGDLELPDGGDDYLPFDHDAAREFDVGLRPGRGHGADQFVETPETFDPAAAAAFDADRAVDYPYAPSAADLGAAPADRFDAIGLGRGAPQLVDDDHDLIEEADVSQPIDLPPSYDGGVTVDGPVESPEPPFHHDGGYAAARPPSSLEDDLDEVDFYVSQDMVVEAADLLRNLLDRHPGHPLITAKLRDLEAVASGYPVDAYEAEPAVGPAHAGAIEAVVDLDDDEIEELDVDDVLETADALDDHEVAHDHAPPSPVVAAVVAPAPRPSKPAVVLEKPIDDSDAETHYDLGLAYKEMGLYDEAIKAFEKLTNHAVRSVQCRLMIGLCRREQGNHSEAIHAFKAGLHAPQVNDREKQSLFYEIGVTYEAMGDVREALYYFEMVTKRDPGFLDTGDRLARLRGGDAAPRHGLGDDSDGAIDAMLDDV
jgi:pilus assembly protein FimV